MTWLVKRLMDVLCSRPIGNYRWGGDLYQWVGRHWLYPLRKGICPADDYGYIQHGANGECPHDPDAYCGWCGRPLPCPESEVA